MQNERGRRRAPKRVWCDFPSPPDFFQFFRGPASTDKSWDRRMALEEGKAFWFTCFFPLSLPPLLARDIVEGAMNESLRLLSPFYCNLSSCEPFGKAETNWEPVRFPLQSFSTSNLPDLKISVHSTTPFIVWVLHSPNMSMSPQDRKRRLVGSRDSSGPPKRARLDLDALVRTQDTRQFSRWVVL